MTHLEDFSSQIYSGPGGRLTLNLSSRGLYYLPDSVCQLTQLQCLIISDNKLQKLPKNIRYVSFIISMVILAKPFLGPKSPLVRNYSNLLCAYQWNHNANFRYSCLVQYSHFLFWEGTSASYLFPKPLRRKLNVSFDHVFVDRKQKKVQPSRNQFWIDFVSSSALYSNVSIWLITTNNRR